MSDRQPLEVLSAVHFGAKNGDLRVLDSSLLPFDVARLFFIKAPDGSIRGQHSHLEGQQFLIVVSGLVEVRIEDPQCKKHIFKMKEGECILVPPLHWASEHFEGETSVLLVLCDSPFAEKDYIRDYSTFLNQITPRD